MLEDQNQKNGDNGSRKKPPGLKVPTFTWVAWIAIIGCIVLLMYLRNRLAPQGGMVMSQAEFLVKFQSNQITHFVLNYNPQSQAFSEITGTYLNPHTPDNQGGTTNKAGAFVTNTATGKPEETRFLVPEVSADPKNAGRIV